MCNAFRDWVECISKSKHFNTGTTGGGAIQSTLPPVPFTPPPESKSNKNTTSGWGHRHSEQVPPTARKGAQDEVDQDDLGTAALEECFLPREVRVEVCMIDKMIKDEFSA